MNDANEMSDDYTGDEDACNEMSDGYLGSHNDPVPQYAPMSKSDTLWLCGLFGFMAAGIVAACLYSIYG